MKQMNYLVPFLCYWMGLFSFTSPQETMAQKKGLPPKSLMGTPYDVSGWIKPPGEIGKRLLKRGYRELTILIPPNQSNWNRLENLDGSKLKSIRLFGFGAMKGDFDDTLDERILEEKRKKQFFSGLDYHVVLRKATSDIAGSSWASGGGNYLGVLRFDFDGEPPLIVGVGKANFFLDVWYGSDRQAFHSRPLAEALKRWLKDKHKISLKDEWYNELSGLNRMKLPKVFEK